MTYLLKKRTDLSPKEGFETIENLSFSKKDVLFSIKEQIDSFPNLKERFFYEAKKNGKYIPSRRMILESYSYENNQGPEQTRTRYSNENIKFSINPDSVFQDKNWNQKRLYVLNMTKGPVVISMGQSKNKNDADSYFKIMKIVPLSKVPEKFFNFYGFIDCFYRKNPTLVFLTEEEYRIKKNQIEEEEQKYEAEKERIQNSVDERGGHLGVSHSEDKSESLYSDYSSNKSGGKTVDGVYLYDESPSFGKKTTNSLAEPLMIDDIIKMAKGNKDSYEDQSSDDDVMDNSNFREIIKQIEGE